MSFDETPGDEMTSESDFSHKFSTLLDENNMSFVEACQRANVPYATAFDAVMRGSYGLPATMEILQRLLAVLGADLSYLLSSAPIAARTYSEKRRAIRSKVWEFIIRDNMPRPHRRQFVNYILAKLENKPSHTLRIAARSTIPHTMVDLGHEYQRLLRQGFFQD